MPSMLTDIIIELPSNTFEDTGSFTKLFDYCDISASTIAFDTVPSQYLPSITLRFVSDLPKPRVLFQDLQENLSTVTLENSTGQIWESKYKYTKLSVKTLTERLHDHGIKFQYYDHLGINIPNQEGKNEILEELYDKITSATLLHDFPGASDWRFIIPGSKEEIVQRKIDYAIDRKPKFEFVNFKTCSTPILQIDIATNVEYQLLKELFPEGIQDDELKNLWIYLENETELDICLVLNEMGSGWTKAFSGGLVNA